ncbi:G-PROTEIN-RECEP-F1-2 domain-containing protein [Aphelenchoides besseyi]|nr:G-PROTEIN-RECEP-F1-2 domain-containing protein [Aphelenchoides besseyi]
MPNLTTTPPSIEDYDQDFLKNMSDDDYIDFVAQFLRPIPIEYAFVFVYCCLMVVGVIGNCLVVYVVLRNKAMRDSSINLYLGNLAMADLLVLTICLPPTIATDVTKTFWLGVVCCKTILFFQNTSVYVSILTLTTVALERWRAVSNPLAAPIWRTQKVIPCLWITAAILSLPEPLTLQIFPADYERKNIKTTWGTRCAPDWSLGFQQKYQLIQTCLLFFVPLLIITGLCIHMSIILRRKALQIGERQIRSRKRATRILITVTLLFGISYLPVHAHNILSAFQIDPHEPTLVAIAVRKFIPRLFSYSASSLNPIVYSLSSEKFRKEFRRVWCFGNQRKDLRDRQRSMRSTLSGATATNNL